MSGKSWMDLGMEQVENGLTSVKQQVSSAPQSVASSVISQITGKSPSDVNTSHARQEQQQAAHKANQDVVRELYAPSSGQHDDVYESTTSSEPVVDVSTESQKAASDFIRQKIDEGMSVEDAQKLYSLRKKLHSEYYQKLISYERSRPEERTAEKVEKEKEQDDRMNLEEKQKKDAPLAVQMGANRAEKFPGASG